MFPHFGSKPLCDIRRRDIRDYIDKRAGTIYTRKDKREKRIAPLTVAREAIALAAMFTYAVDAEYIPAGAHPVKRLKIPEGETKKQCELLPEEVVRLFRVIRDSSNPRLAYLEPILLTALNAGLREGSITPAVLRDRYVFRNPAGVEASGRHGSRS